LNSLNASLQQTFCYYNSFVGINSLPDQQSSGAYIFRPTEQDPTCLHVRKYTKRQTSLVQEVHQIYNEWISQTIRLYDNENSVEFEWQVGPIPVGILAGKEVITKFTSDLQSNGTFYTDANGREMLKRTRNFRQSWPNFNQTEPVSGNYYPINSQIYIKDETRQLTLVTDRSQGGSSIHDGSIEVMLHRRIFMDDSLGVGEPLDEIGVNLRGLIAKGKQYLFFNKSEESARWHRDKAHKINMQPLVTFPMNSSDLFKNLNKFEAIKQSLPDNVELLTLVHDANSIKVGINALIVRFEHFYEVNEDPVLSQPVSIDINQVFDSTFQILDFEELALGANIHISELSNRLTWNYTGIESIGKVSKTK
jgi:lysosomal alpha-mannosidase